MSLLTEKKLKLTKLRKYYRDFHDFMPQQLPATHSVTTAHMRQPWHGDNAHHLAGGLKVGR